VGLTVEISFEVDYSGAEPFLRLAAGAGVDVVPAIRDGLLSGAIHLVSEIQDSLGTAYPPASAPGDPPHLRTGVLRRSVRIEEVGDDYVKVSAGGVGDLAPYAVHLEYGTSRMQPRPFVEPAVQAAIPDIEARVRDAVEAYVRDELGV